MIAAVDSPPAAPPASRDLSALHRALVARAPAIAGTDARQRRAKLLRLHTALLAARHEAVAAVQADYYRAAEEIDVTETAVVLREIRHALRHVGRWMRPRRVPVPLAMIGSTAEVVPEPKGAALIIAPWNFPIQLALVPLVSAIAAGCPAVVKPSEITPHTAAWLRDLLARVFPPDEVAVVEGDAAVSQQLLALRWGHIFFTGSPEVGKVVMRAAAEHLGSVTLELGGKSPALVDASANLDLAAEKIAWGKFYNAGQICISPDYVLADSRIAPRLEHNLAEAVHRFFGPDPARSPDYARLVNARHFERVRGLLDDAVARGARIVCGGEADPATRYIAPTVLANVMPASRILHEEIFGPVLPLIAWEREDDALDFIRARENPLAMYVFSRDNAAIARYHRGTRAGGGCVNDALFHYFHQDLPFGGAGWSGLGRAHGEAGFLSFSNPRGILRRRFGTADRLLYPPFTPWSRRLIDVLMRWL